MPPAMVNHKDHYLIGVYDPERKSKVMISKFLLRFFNRTDGSFFRSVKTPSEPSGEAKSCGMKLYGKSGILKERESRKNIFRQT
jgi:hypothetical protein